jgi:hypothetical protein
MTAPGILARLPADVATSLTAEQAAAIRLHLGARYEHTHALNVRRSFRIFGRQFYMVFLAGSAARGGS